MLLTTYSVGFINKFEIFQLKILGFAVGMLDVSNESQLQNLFMQYLAEFVNLLAAVSSVVAGGFAILHV